MTKVLTNLTLPTVVQMIEEVLEVYPDHPYQQMFAIPDMHQKLVAFVLSRVQNVYDAIEGTDKIEERFGQWRFPTEERLHIESIVHEGIHSVLVENSIKLQTQIPEPAIAGRNASHWFG